MDCGTYFAKYVLCLFNFVFFIIGAVLVAVGVWLYFDKDSLFSLIKLADNASFSELQQIEDLSDPTMVEYVSYILMATGACIFILSLLGYCGALRESRCLLGCYGTLLIVVLVLEIAAGTMAYIYKDRVDTELRTVLKSTISNYTITEVNSSNLGKGPTLLWNTIMLDLSCCGVDNYTDFSEALRQSDYKVPPYCCAIRNGTLADSNCPTNPTQANSYYLTGCYQTIMNMIQTHMNIVIYTTVAVVLFELLSTALAFCLCKNLESYDDK